MTARTRFFRPLLPGGLSLALFFFSLLFLAVCAERSAAQPGLIPAIDALLPPSVKLSDSAAPPNLASSYRVDFALPDAPAFTLLDDNPGDILRPSGVKEFAVALSSFIDTATGGIDIPQAFAVEFSPGLLIGGNDLSLREYQANPWLYRLRLSAGTRRMNGSAAPSEIAVGIRTSFIDQSDLRTDTALLGRVTAITDQIVQVAAASIGRPDAGGSGAEVVSYSRLTPQGQAQVDSLNTLLQQAIGLAQDQAAQQWNARALDLAVAALFSSKDSLVKGLQTSEVAAWLTWAEGFGSWGQLLLGGKAGFGRGITADSLLDTASSGEMDFAATLSGRFYIGTNAYKVFTELQWTGAKNTDMLLINGGGEAMLRSGLWVSFGGGVERNLDAGTWNLVSKFTVKLGLPFLD